MLQPRASSFKMKFVLSVGLFIVVIIMLVVSFLNPPRSTQKMQATVFSQPRKISAFQFKAAFFSQKNLFDHWTFLFFGYTHCSQVCPATLTELNEVYLNLHAQYPNLQIVFVSIDPQGEKLADVQHYLVTFNKHFIGLSGTNEEIDYLKQQFSLYTDRDSRTGVLNHTSSVFLINPQGQWLALFPYGQRSKQIQDQFKIIVRKETHV